MLDLRVRDTVRDIDVKLVDLGFNVLNIDVASISVNRNTQHLLGSDGNRDGVVEEIERDIDVLISFSADNPHEFMEKEAKLRYLFGTGHRMVITRRISEDGGIIFEKPNQDNSLQLSFFDELSWDVGMNGSFKVNRNGLMGMISLTFTTIEIPYGFTEDESYEFSPSTFTQSTSSRGKYTEFYYDGNKEINQLKLPFLFEVTKASFDNIGIFYINDTQIRLSKLITTVDLIQFDGYNYNVNGDSYVRQTNRGFFKVNHGINTIGYSQFTPTANTVFKLTFRNYFY